MGTVETPQPTESKSIEWTKIILAAAVGFGLLAASAYAGYWYGTESADLKSQIQETPTPVVSQPTPTPSPTPISSPIPPPSDRISCEQAGGKWGSWRDMLNATPECNLPTSDAGKECTDSSQCESYCQAEEGAKRGDQASGRCYEWQSVYTCMQEVRGGVVDVTWCY